VVPSRIRSFSRNFDDSVLATHRNRGGHTDRRRLVGELGCKQISTPILSPYCEEVAVVVEGEVGAGWLLTLAVGPVGVTVMRPGQGTVEVASV
jgi:hypothetical protein